MTVPYKPISFSPSGEFSRDKLNQMANNDQWLFEQMPRMLYNAHSVKRTSSLKIMCGIATIPRTSSGGTNVSVYFGTFFSAGCRPVVTVAPVQRPPQYRVHSAISGLETSSFHPDHRGCRVHAWVDARYTKDYIANTIWVHWQAIGW